MILSGCYYKLSKFSDRNWKCKPIGNFDFLRCLEISKVIFTHPAICQCTHCTAISFFHFSIVAQFFKQMVLCSKFSSICLSVKWKFIHSNQYKTIQWFFLFTEDNFTWRDSTDGSAAASYPADPGSYPALSMLQRVTYDCGILNPDIRNNSADLL